MGICFANYFLYKFILACCEVFNDKSCYSDEKITTGSPQDSWGPVGDVLGTFSILLFVWQCPILSDGV